MFLALLKENVVYSWVFGLHLIQSSSDPSHPDFLTPVTIIISAGKGLWKPNNDTEQDLNRLKYSLSCSESFEKET